MYHFLSSKQFDNFLVYSIYVLHLNYPSTFFVFMENMFWVLILRTAPRVPCCSPAACRTVCQPRVFCQPHAALHRAAGLHLHGPCPRPGQAEHPRALHGSLGGAVSGFKARLRSGPTSAGHDLLGSLPPLTSFLSLSRTAAADGGAMVLPAEQTNATAKGRFRFV
jgi:hypothetical protein